MASQILIHSSVFFIIICILEPAQCIWTTSGEQCVFPFIYEGVEYTSCTLAGSDSGKLWCSVTDNYDRDGRWGYCGADPQPGFADCPLVADVTFILEPLTGFSDSDWHLTRTFLTRFVDNLPISSLNTRIAIVSSDMPGAINLNTFYDRSSLETVIDDWNRPLSKVKMADLFDTTANVVYSRKNGDRADAENIVVILTNGQGSTDQSNEASVRAYLLQEKASVFVIGVTKAGQDLARQIKQDDRKTFYVSSFEELNTLVFPPIISALCKKDESNSPCSSVQVTKITPNFGLSRGGDLVTIVGCHLVSGSEVPTVLIGDSVCQIQSLSASAIQCITGPSISLTIQELQIQPTKSLSYRTQHFFNYASQNEPVVSEIIPSPPKTILSGSVAITIKGRNFPQDIKMLATVKTALIPGLGISVDCQTVDNTQFICRTPALTAFLPSEVRKKRSLVEKSRLTPQGLVDMAGTKRRLKRQVQSARVDEEGRLEVALGFNIPGTDKYRELGLLFPSAEKLQVYRDPNLFSFSGAQKFRPFAPYNQKTIAIKGERLDQGLRKEDYSILIGDGVCQVVELSYNEVKCEPPSSIPESGTATVTVKVGSIIFSPGQVDFDSNQWEDKGFRGGIAFFIFAFVAVTIVIWVIVACVYQRRIQTADQNALPVPKPKKEKKLKKAKLSNQIEEDCNGHIIPQDQNRVETPSLRVEDPPQSHMNTGVSVEGYDRRDWAY